MNATSRSSPPRSPAMPTIPDAPPAIIPSVAVGRSSSVKRASIQPVAMLSASVAALTISDRQPRVPERLQRVGLQVRADRHAERPPAPARNAPRGSCSPALRAGERGRQPDEQGREQRRRRQPDRAERDRRRRR